MPLCDCKLQASAVRIGYSTCLAHRQFFLKLREVVHDELAADIPPEEAQTIVDLQEGDFIERCMRSSQPPHEPAAGGFSLARAARMQCSFSLQGLRMDYASAFPLVRLR